MYLVHARLGPARDTGLPSDAAALVRRCAQPRDGVEFVVAHPEVRGGPVFGIFLLAPSLELAESSAERVCLRALSRYPAFRGFALLSCAVAMPRAYFEKLFEESGEPPG
ncbi:hypothetical protein [Streptomyces spectabilis]|uniref:Uncharacterized protein n=1 Tax=Streptomyces spectabilis TaxID=68270 RepID=A0A5P2WZD9_STRST|nr:hypothetical protein [Streptomyces spectabilis]MBB5108904.1 hypothetical protein [Streptomyces spectabilis]MCI3899802.1 hypothetical protein [Streptomyces spectabilis]QEV57468.1 hypothetical protein CP982_00920 [Streptomyces spectabilis]GGV42837.1 hypothetical protein GCM10010245_67250 [Streptomyces spectabilis]